MKGHWNYLKGVARHKWYVFRACLLMGVPLWRAIVHDWTKFLPVEWGPYVRQFYNPDGTNKPSIRDKTGAYDPSLQPREFQIAWISHQRNKHHWQAWVSIGDYGKLAPVPMPETYIREMVADWIGAGLSYSGKADPLGWYKANGDKMVLHISTELRLVAILSEAKKKLEEGF